MRVADARQFDLFAAPPPRSCCRPLDEIAEEEAIAEQEAEAERRALGPAYHDSDENEAGELAEGEQMPDWPADPAWDRHRRDWHERQAIKAATVRADAAGRIERLAWGQGTKPGFMPWGKPGYRLEMFEEGGTWFARSETSLPNGASCGPFWLASYKGAPLTTRETVILHHMRSILKRAANAQVMDHEPANAKAMEQMARWAICQCPELIYGADLAEEYAALCQSAEAR